MGELKFEARTLDDKLIKEGLCAASALEDKSVSRGSSFVVGGIATQSYLPSVYRRPTSDIDLAVLKSLNPEDFREFSSSAVDYLKDKGYNVHLKKGHLAFQIVYAKDGEGTAVIEFPRRNSNNFNRRKDRLQVEYANTRNKIVEGRDKTYKVASPEDIAVPKIVRGVGSLIRNPDFCEHVRAGRPVALSDEQVREEFGKISEVREDALLHVGDPRYAEHLRFISDIFDIRALSEVVGFNPAYLREVMNSWDVLENRSEASRLLINYLLPQM